jgi:phosphatidylinositol-3,4,5-trisphosphate 3-phosphatase/dual-specificity protein phosphatase PTEN
VSRNRLRYKDCEFNLDLSYITRRVIAMGYPGSGLNGLVRNHVGDVILYFKKYHSLKIKIYNMCNDKFVDPQVLRLETPAQDRDVRLAYFPMMDHNPGPIPTIFKFVIDAVLYLASDPENTVAVHCKAGKGRTGLAICAYFLFIEAVENAELAVTLFNSRRTTNGKGLGIAS